MKILTVGGGSGGHIIPVAAVVNQINKIAPDAEVIFWCDKKSLALAQTAFVSEKIAIKTISAGKFRRYHHFAWWQHLRPTILIPNVIDLFKIAIGFVQSFWRLMVIKPDVVFAKGGFVCMPVGIVAHWLKIPLIIHDSDTVAGLTNRILSKYAVKITTGMPIKYYNYSKEKTIFVGSPVKIASQDQSISEIKQQLELPTDKQIVLISGGGLGSDFLNKLAIGHLGELKNDAFVVLITGRGNYQAIIKQNLNSERIRALDFVANFQDYVRVADLAVARAGATTIAELASMSKPTVLVPNPKLTEGHQLKNAQMLADEQAVVVLDELKLDNRPEEFYQTINRLLLNNSELDKLARNISKFAKKDAAYQLANIILEQVRG